MTVPVISSAYITNLLNEWYQAIRSQHVNEAEGVKRKVEAKLAYMEEDQNVLLYYSLLDFRHSILVSSLVHNDSSVQNIEKDESSMDDFLTYYYHLFKGIYAMNNGQYSDARIHYRKAEALLDFVPDGAEKAEFYYRVGTFYYHIYQPLESIRYITNARYFYLENFGYERNIASCDNIMGLCCISLKQFDQAEAHFLTSLKQLLKLDEKKLILKVSHNLGFLYAEQGLSDLAIPYLLEAVKNNPKTMFLLAREYNKLGMNQKAQDLISEGMKSCDEEYKHHFSILKAVATAYPVDRLEQTVSKAIRYFKKEGLWKYVEEYCDMVAVALYRHSFFEQASAYFLVSHEAKKKSYEKESLL